MTDAQDKLAGALRERVKAAALQKLDSLGLVDPEWVDADAIASEVAKAIIPIILAEAAGVARDYDTFDRDTPLSARGAVVALGIADAIEKLGA